MERDLEGTKNKARGEILWTIPVIRTKVFRSGLQDVNKKILKSLVLRCNQLVILSFTEQIW